MKTTMMIVKIMMIVAIKFLTEMINEIMYLEQKLGL